MAVLSIGQVWGATYEKATSIAAGDVVLLVYETGKYELNGISTTNTKYGLGASYTTTPAGVYELTVEAGSSAGTFAFKNGSNYLTWTSGNSLNKATSKSNNTSWTVSFSGGNATIANAADDSRTIRWNNNSGQYRFACYTSGQQAVQLYKKSTGGSSTCATPTFSPAAGVYHTAQNVTISCETTDATIYYTTNGNDPTTSSDVYTSPIAVSSAMTIKALAVKSGLSNSAASAKYAFTENAGTEANPYTVADAKIVIDAIGTKSDAYVTGTISQVDSYNSTYHSITYWISDDGTTTNQFEVYGGKGLNGADFTKKEDLSVGDQVVVKGNLKKFNSTYEFDTNSQLVSLDHPTSDAGVITATPASVEVAAAGEDNGSIAISYTGISDMDNVDNEVYLYNDEAHTSAFTGGWLTAAWNGDKSAVEYIVNANTGAARTAYIYLFAIDDNGDDVEKVIEVSQAKYSVDYATLPFAFNGGRANIEDKDGMTQEGLDSDYTGDSNADTRLKFNTTGDVVTIKINADPGTLTYNIKGNSYSGSTFKVQQSADGVDYSDVATYTELGAVQSESKTLAKTTRYVKFIYTAKVNGNVALGNIAISEYVAPTACEAPTFTPESGETFTETLDVVLASATDGATIYYTLDGSEPTTASSVFSEKITLTETTTINAIAVKDGLSNSSVASATFTKVLVIDSYEIDFETNDLAPYVNWEFSNIAIRGTITAHGGSDYASNASSSEATTGTASCTITTKAKYANPGTLTFYISKESNNTTASSWVAQVSEDGTDWTDIEPSFDAKSMNKGDWDKCEADLSAYTNVYVRIAYSGSTAIRAIDDISLEPAAPVKKPVISDEESFLTSAEVSITCGTTGATIYYTTDGSDPKSGSVYSSSFTLTETATVRAIAKLDDDWSAEAESKTFTKIIPYTTIAGLAEDMTNTATPVYITLGNWQVSVVKNSQAFVTDGENGLIIYQSNHGLKEGDVLSGTIQCNLVNYNDVVELTGVKKGETSGLTVTDGTINPIVKTIAEANALTVLNTGLLIKLENVTYNEGEFEDEDNNTIAPYTTFYDYSSDLEDGKKYNITGIIQKYQSAIQIYPRKQADIQEVADASAPETPTFSPEGGVYTEAQSVIITCATEGATIYYTTDGSAPDNTKTLYEGAINVEATTTIKAIAIKDDKSSVVASATFTINIPEDESVSKTWDLSIASYDANPTEEQVTWSATYVNMVADKANSTTAANNYLGGDANNRTSSRFYKNSTLTITPNAKEITSVVFTATSASYANALQGSEWTNASASVDGTTVTVTPTDGKIAISAVIGGTCGFTAVQVIYKDLTPVEPEWETVRGSLTAGNYYTVCYNKTMTAIKGASLWEFEGKDAAFAYIKPATAPYPAGKPYIVYAESEKLEAVLEGDEVTASAIVANGALHGTFSPMDQDALNTAATAAGHDLYLVIGNELRRATGTGTDNNTLPAQRAYVVLDEIGSAPANMPAHVRSMPLHKDTATGMDELNASETPVKVMINGQMYILRGEKIYDATGRLVK